KMSWDWSAAGDRKRPASKYPSGLPRYDWQKGAFTWGRWVKPTYAWYNGYTRRHLLGDRINLKGVTVLTRPEGSPGDKTARIYPFKVHDAVQGADAEYNYLLVPHLWTDGGFWKTADWQRSFIQGMKAAGLKYSGKYKWVKTRMYWVLAHQVGPAETALSCAQCHPILHRSPEKGCARCHDEMRGQKYVDLIRRGLSPAWVKKAPLRVRKTVIGTDWLDFKALGYKGDPIEHGGRGD
ncbi:MAG: class III cytochrome C, partial [Proteobacteria bacterium]|nr:class III cytochrome C [Pseudomonadota bacterium]